MRSSCRACPGPNGKLMHGAVRIGDSVLMLTDEMPEWGSLGPLALKGSPVVLHLYVPDADAAFAQAVAAGCTVTLPIADMFWGDRYGQVVDPYGHRWSIATHLKDHDPRADGRGHVQDVSEPPAAMAGTRLSAADRAARS